MDTFTGFGLPTLDDEGNVLFHADGPDLVSSGIYRSGPMALEVVADTTTVLPGTGERFDVFSPFLSAGGGEVCFVGQTSPSGHDAVVHGEPGDLRVLVDESTPVPGTLEPFHWLFSCNVGASRNVIVGGPFGGALDPDLGAYVHDGVGLSVLADDQTPITGEASGFVGVFFPAIADRGGSTRVTLAGRSTVPAAALFLWQDGALTRIVTAGDPLPASAGTFGSLGLSSFTRETVLVIGGLHPSRMGLYAWRAGALSPLVTPETPIPGRSETFGSVPFVAGRPDGFVVVGRDSSDRSGLYGDFGAGLQTILDAGDPLDGGDVTSLELHPQSLLGNDFTFRALFQDGSSAVFRARLEPAIAEVPGAGTVSIAVLALLLAVLGGWALRR